MRARQRILEATLEIVRADGFDAVSISSVAQAAGASRQTIYRNFDGADDLVLQAVGSLVSHLRDELEARTQAVETPLDYVVELIVSGRALARADPLVTRLITPSEANPFFDPSFIDGAKAVLREAYSTLVSRSPELQAGVDDVVEVSVRLALSVILFDDPALEDDDRLRAFLRRWIGPGLPEAWR